MRRGEAKGNNHADFIHFSAASLFFFPKRKKASGFFSWCPQYSVQVYEYVRLHHGVCGNKRAVAVLVVTATSPSSAYPSLLL